MLREIEVMLISGPGHDRAVMPNGTVLERRGDEKLSRSIMNNLVPGILKGFESPISSYDIHRSVLSIEVELLQKFVGKFLSDVRAATTIISEL